MKTLIKGCDSAWPTMAYREWSDTLKTIHHWTQIVGKIRLKAMPWQNHSWHTTLYISSKGFSTGSMPYEDGIFELEFDFENHQLAIHTTFNETRRISLINLSVSGFYHELLNQLKSLNISINIHTKPNEMEEAIPFSENTHQAYDGQAVVKLLAGSSKYS